MSLFKDVKVKEVKRETEDTVSIAFDIPEALKSEFDYKSGQYITIKSMINGEDVRRAYSLSSAPYESDFRIAVKQIENGKMSTFLNQEVKNGDALEVMPPAGNFCIDKPNPSSAYVGFAAGSGITPIISILKTVLSKDENSTFTLYYGNKTLDSTIFKSDLDELQSQFKDRLTINYILSRESASDSLYEGRITKEKCDDLMKKDLSVLKSEAFYLCGPEEMIMGVKGSLEDFGVDTKKIKFELFTASATTEESKPVASSGFDGTSHVTVIMDGDEFEFDLDGNGDFILDASIDAGVDAPFSCKGAVCCTCKAQVIEGEATMELNYSLSDEEVANGFILTCQAHPASKNLVVDFDVI